MDYSRWLFRINLILLVGLSSLIPTVSRSEPVVEAIEDLLSPEPIDIELARNYTDLRCSVMDIEYANFLWGENVIIDFTIRNTGQGDLRNVSFTQKFYISKDNSLGDDDDHLLGSSVYSGELLAGRSRNLRVTLRLPSERIYSGAGPFPLLMKIDSQAEIPEPNEGNNTCMSLKGIRIPHVSIHDPDLYIHQSPDSEDSDFKKILNSPTILEGDSGSWKICFPIVLDGDIPDPSKPISVYYRTVDITATVEDQDYEPIEGRTKPLAPVESISSYGEENRLSDASARICIPIIGDDVVEKNESLHVH